MTLLKNQEDALPDPRPLDMTQKIVVMGFPALGGIMLAIGLYLVIIKDSQSPLVFGALGASMILYTPSLASRFQRQRDEVPHLFVTRNDRDMRLTTFNTIACMDPPWDHTGCRPLNEYAGAGWRPGGRSPYPRSGIPVRIGKPRVPRRPEGVLSDTAPFEDPHAKTQDG